ncbi:HPr kinase/phosphorylase [Novosphingobium soli]|uniref:HPr kinase/phosphorylase n=1 Tax=Novosphingobium soli TaxID=574956 RepID=A0ABV6CQN0_9SPHN
MSVGAPMARQSTCVAVGGRGVLIEGAPGTGKSTLALALIDRGAVLVGDDSLLLSSKEGTLFASPHPRTLGILEVRNLGLLPFPCLERAPVALVLMLDPAAPRFVEAAERVEIAGVALPFLRLCPHGEALALKAELALRHYAIPD